MVRLDRILRDYQDAGSVNSLLALWGFVDDTTFLTKAGHVGVVYRVRGVDYEGLTHAQRRALVHRFEAAFGCSTSTAASTSTSSSGRSTRSCLRAVRAAGRARGDSARAAYLNDRRHELYDLGALPGPRSTRPPDAVARSTRLRRALARAARALSAPGCRPTRHAARCSRRELDRAIGTLHHKADAFEVQLSDFGLDPAHQARGVPLLPPARELRPGGGRRRLADVRHAPGLLRRATPPSTAIAITCWSATDCVKVLTMKEPPSQTFAHLLQDLLRDSRRVHRLPRMAAHPERPDAARHPDAPPALLQQARVDRELRVA